MYFNPNNQQPQQRPQQPNLMMPPGSGMHILHNEDGRSLGQPPPIPQMMMADIGHGGYGVQVQQGSVQVMVSQPQLHFQHQTPFYTQQQPIQITSGQIYNQQALNTSAAVEISTPINQQVPMGQHQQFQTHQSMVSGHSHLAHQQPQVIPSQQSSLPQPSLVGPTSSLAISQHPTIQSNVTGGSASHLPAQQINPIAATGQGSGSMSTPTVNVKSFRNNETDLIASTRLLILKDLRKAMNDLNVALLNLVEQTITKHSRNEEEKKAAATSGTVGLGPSSNINVGGGPHSNLTSGPHSNLNISTGGPHSNLGPQSNLNPLSVQNPQSVQPHSVKSGGISEEASKEAPHKDSPGGQYQNALDNFNNVYYEIEERLVTIKNVFQMCSKMENYCSNYSTPAEFASSTLPNLMDKYITTMNSDKNAIEQFLVNSELLRQKIENATKKRTETEQVSALSGDVNKTQQQENAFEMDLDQ